MFGESPLVMADQLIFIVMLIPVVISLIAIVLLSAVIFCAVLIAPFGIIAATFDRRRAKRLNQVDQRVR